MNRLAVYALFLGVLTLSGCLSSTTQLQPDDVSVQATHFGEDCTPIILGIDLGTTTTEGARQKARNREAMDQASREGNGTGKHWIDVPIETIGKVRRLESTDYWFLVFGARCIEVTGEGAGAVKTSAR